MTTRDEQREWLSKSKGWKPEREAVGVERLVDVMQVIDAGQVVYHVDLRRWRRFDPKVADQILAARIALAEANRLMMEKVQDKVGPPK